MQSVDTRPLERAFEALEEAEKAFPGAKKQMLEALGRELQEDVTDNMATSGLRNSGGRLRAWQKYHVGSKGGYVAVRAIGTADGGASGPNGPGAITNYTENGHKVRRPSGTAKQRRRSRAKVPAVPGHHYYRATESGVEQRAEAALVRLAEDMARRMEGRL